VHPLALISRISIVFLSSLPMDNARRGHTLQELAVVLLFLCGEIGRRQEGEHGAALFGAVGVGHAVYVGVG